MGGVSLRTVSKSSSINVNVPVGVIVGSSHVEGEKSTVFEHLMDLVTGI